MPSGYLVNLGDNSLDVNDAIGIPATGFTIQSVLGTGSWTWSGTWAGNGQTYNNITDGGTYYLATTGQVFFVPDRWDVTSGTASVTATPPGGGAAFVNGTDLADVIDAGFVDPEGQVVDGGDGSGVLGHEDTILAGAGDDSVNAGQEADLVFGQDGADTIDGGTGNDTAYGGEGADSLMGGDGADSLMGDAGNDTIDGGAGDDTLEGGAGDDVVSGGTGNDVVDGGAGDDQLTGGAGTDEILGGDGIDTIDGGLEADTLHGGGGDDSMSGGDGADLMHGDSTGGAIGTGSDDIGSILMTAGSIRPGSNTGDLTDAQVGDSVIYDNAGTMTNGDPVVIRLTVTEITDPGLTVTLNYNTANGPILIDGNGNPAMAGESVSFSVEFLNGNTLEPLVVSGSANIIDIDDNAGAGAEFVTLDAANFNGYALDASSSLNVVTGPEGITGTGSQGNGAADEPAWITGLFTDQSQLNFTLGAVENGAAYGFNGAELTTQVVTEVNAGGSDTLEGGAGADTILGGSGNDSLSGGADDDHLVGGVGNDTLDGGTGADSVEGGSGDDVIRLGDSFGNDTIIGGETSETAGDTLDLTGNTTGVTVDLSGADPEAGTVAAGRDTATFSEIENITLGAGQDRVVLADGSGADSVSGFDMTDRGDGYTRDQVDVTGMTTDGVTPVTADDVVVTDDGLGNAVLTFPGGETLTLIGVAPTQVDSFAELVHIGIPPGRDFIVEGTAGAETIDGGYLGDPEGDLIDAADNLQVNDADSIEAYGGNDSVLAGAGADTVHAGMGADTVEGGTGADLIFGDADNDSLLGGQGADTLEGGLGSDTLRGGTEGDSLTGGTGNDSLFGDEGADTLEGGIGIDVLDGGSGNDLLYGGDGNDTVFGNTGDDTLFGGDGSDFLRGSFGADALHGGAGGDSIWGGFGDDTIVVADGFGNDTIDGDASAETLGDTLDLSATTTGLRVDLTDVNPENGSFTDGTGTATFTDIENIVLGGGNDTIALADLGGADIVQGFTAPTVNGDGSLTANDVLDVSALTSDGGVTPVHAGDVVVSDDGAGNAVLTFPGGESLTLVGIPPATASDPAWLVAVGVPSDGILTGTEGADTIVAGSWIDEDTDVVDGGDAHLPGEAPQDDIIRADGGDDSVVAGLGNDEIDGGFGSDTLGGGAGNDSILGGAGADSVTGDAGNDTLSGQDGADTLEGGAGADVLSGGEAADSLLGGGGNDTLDGGLGRDTLDGGAGDDSISGGADQDYITLNPSEGADVIDGGSTGTDQDTLGLTDALGATVTLTGDEAGSVTTGTGSATFNDIEALELGAGDDTVQGGGGNFGMTIDGGAGADSLRGGNGADTLLGGADADYIVGGRGDVIDGGSTGVDNDTLEIRGPAVITFDPLNTENGTVTWLDGGTLSFTDIETVNYIPCFTPGTQIKTARGEVAVERLRVGDRVLTRDNGYQAIRWVGLRRLKAAELAERPKLRPVHIARGALGPDMPERDMQVSPQHRVLIGNAATQLWFGEEEVLVAATHLTCLDGAEVAGAGQDVTYIHILFDQHEVVLSDGIWSESFQPGDKTLAALDGEQRSELLTLFPELDGRENLHEVYPAARTTLKGHQAQVLLTS